jgi:hypothetical protein
MPWKFSGFILEFRESRSIGPISHKKLARGGKPEVALEEETADFGVGSVEVFLLWSRQRLQWYNSRGLLARWLGEYCNGRIVGTRKFDVRIRIGTPWIAGEPFLTNILQPIISFDG